MKVAWKVGHQGSRRAPSREEGHVGPMHLLIVVPDDLDSAGVRI